MIYKTFLPIAVLAAAAPANASTLTYTPTNPSFGGSPFNSAHLLGVANAINKYEDPASKQASDPAQQFVDQLLIEAWLK